MRNVGVRCTDLIVGCMDVSVTAGRRNRGWGGGAKFYRNVLQSRRDLIGK